jgi:hypothetical protein
MNRVAPDYQAARTQFAGDTVLLEALEEGRNALNMDPRTVERTMREYSPDQKRMFRMGAVDSIRQRMAQAADNAERANVIKSVFGFGKGEKRERLRALFENQESFDRFEAQMRAELDMKATRDFNQSNSNTATKVAEMADQEAPIADALVDAAGGNFKTAGMRLARPIADNTIGRVRAGFRESTRADVARTLYDEGAAAEDFLRSLEKAQQDRLARQRSRSSLGRSSAFIAGGTGGE